MARDTMVLDSLDINDGINYSARIDIDLTEPPLRTDLQPFLQGHGSSVIEGTNYRDVATHKINIKIKGTSLSNLYANISALQAKIIKKDIVFQYKYKGSTNSNYADVLFIKGSLPFDEVGLKNLKPTYNLELICKPGWRPLNKTEIALQTLSATPAKIAVGTVLGDLKTPAFIEIQGQNAFGNDIYIGSKAEPVSESLFFPVKDFTGTADATGFGGSRYRKTGVDATWDSMMGQSQSLLETFFISSTVGWAVGLNGTILKTTDGGVTWTAQTSGTTQHLTDVFFISSTVGWATGFAGTILKTTDGGTSWAAQTSGSTDDLYGVHFIDANTGWACGTNFTLLYTTNGGTNWYGATTGATTLNSVFFISSTVGWMVGGSGGIWKSTDGGANWVAQTSGTSNNLNDVFFTSSTVGWVVGGSGTILKTTDGGTSWVTQTSGTSQHLHGVYFISSSVGWAVGSSNGVAGTPGTILKTTDGGTNWAAQTSGTSNSLNGVFFIDANTGWAVGNGGVIRYTSNGGTTWTIAEGSWPLAGHDGRYRVFARMKLAVGAADYFARVGSAWGGGDAINNDAVAFANNTAWQWLDLGVVQLPPTNLSPEVDATPVLDIQAMKAASSGDVDIDVAVILPTDGEAIFIDGEATNIKYVTVDADAEAVNKSVNIIDWIGAPIFLRPGNNNLVILENSGIDPVGIRILYYPRYLSPIQ